MKKTIIAMMALAGVAMGAETALTLNITELKSDNSLVLWTNADVDTVESWAFTFTLDTQRASLTDQDLIFLPDLDDELKFAVNANGSLEFYGSAMNNQGLSSAAGMVTTDATVITLKFIANENLQGEITGGTLSAIVGDKVHSATLSTNLTLVKSTNDGIRVWSNGGNEHFTNMSLTKLDNNKLVPEPTTATLSLLALAGLAARRRRK